MTDPNDFIQKRGLVDDSWARELARDLIKNSVDADDLVQDLWLETLQKSTNDVRSPRAWIRGALRNRFLTARRSAARRRQHELRAGADAPASEDPAQEREAVDLVHWALEQVKAPYREAIELRYLDGLSVEQIADRLSCEPAAVRKRLSRGIERIREVLDDNVGRSGSAGWPALLLPLLRPTSMSQEKNHAVVAVSTENGRIETGFRRKGMAALFMAAVVLVLFLSPKLSRTQPEAVNPRSRPSNKTEVEDVAKRPRFVDNAVAATTEKALLPSPDPTLKSVTTPPSKHQIMMTIRLLENRVGIDVPILIEAAPAGPFSMTLRTRRPLSTIPEESTPFHPVGRVQTRSGQRFSLAVPSDGLYRLRVSTEAAVNCVYISTVPERATTFSIDVGRDVKLKILGLSDVADVRFLKDVADSASGVAMDFADDDDDDVRYAKGAFLFPIHIEAETGKSGVRASTRVESSRSTMTLPRFSEAECAVRSSDGDAPIVGFSARSAIYLKDGTAWSILSSGDARGIAKIFGPSTPENIVGHTVHLTAAGFVPQKLNSPFAIKHVRDQQQGQQKDQPLAVQLAPDAKRPSGRILDEFGVPVRQGSVFQISDEGGYLVGMIAKDGRFSLECVMDAQVYPNSKFEYEALNLRKWESVSLLYDDEESTMMRFLDVSSSELEHGTWIGRLPSRKVESLRFVDRLTRSRIIPSELRLLPLAADGKPFGSMILDRFEGRRIPLGGTWQLFAKSMNHEPITTVVDFDRDPGEIELTPRSARRVVATFRKDGGPLSGYPIQILSLDGRKLDDVPIYTTAEGQIEFFVDDDGKKCRYRFAGGEYDASIHSPRELEEGKNNVIDAVPVETVEIQAIDRGGTRLTDVAVLIRKPNGELARDTVTPCTDGKVNLTSEHQILYVLSPSHRPAAITWAPGEGSSSVRVTVERGHRLTFSTVEAKHTEEAHILVFKLIQPFDVGSAPVPSVDWGFQFELDPVNRSKLSTIVAPGRYRLEFTYQNDPNWTQEVDVRGDLDLGEIVLTK